MSKLSKHITTKITEENISPHSKWLFYAKRVLFWSLFVLAIVLGSIAFAVLLFLFFENDVRTVLGPDPRIVITLLKYSLFWILSLVIFFGIAAYSIRQTKKGYRFELWQLTLLNIGSSIVIGVVLYGFGVAPLVESSLQGRLPGYRGFEEKQEELWSQPEKGLLGGVIIEIEADAFLIVEDFSQEIWEVQLPLVPNGRTMPAEILAQLVGRKVKIIGTQNDTSSFTAERIMPWRRQEPFLRGSKPPRPEERMMRLLPPPPPQ